MEKQEVIEALNAIKSDDPEAAHAKADELILAYVPEEVRAAYICVAERCAWWAAA